MPGVVRNGAAHVLDLLGKFTRGRDHEHERTLGSDLTTRAGTGHMGQIVHGGQQKRRGLAGARLGSGKHVLAIECVRDRGSLHGRRGGIAHIGNGGEDLLGQAKVGERGLGAGVLIGRGGEIGFAYLDGLDGVVLFRVLLNKQRHGGVNFRFRAVGLNTAAPGNGARSSNRPRKEVHITSDCAGRSARWSTFATGISLQPLRLLRAHA